jgi:hypothetical protein
MALRWRLAGLTLLLLVPPLAAEEARDPEIGKVYHVPYHRSATQHVIVRAKINGRGPYNFLIDTGAPALYVATELCAKLPVAPDKQGWGKFDRFEIEGGILLRKVKGRVEDPFQLEGMNGMGLAGLPLHGVIGYTILARYRLEFDFTKDKMTWTRLAFDPPPPEGLGGSGGMPAGLAAIGGAMKVFGAVLGKTATPRRVPRGFLGLELADADGRVTIQAILPGSPGAKTDLRAGDRITAVDGRQVRSAADVLRRAARRKEGETIRVTVERSAQTREIAIRTEEGL